MTERIAVSTLFSDISCLFLTNCNHLLSSLLPSLIDSIEDQEEIDCLRVRVSHDAVVIQELEKAVQQKE